MSAHRVVIDPPVAAPSAQAQPASPLATARRRLRSDFRLATITLFGSCAVLVIQPFGIYRFIVGDWLIGIADTAIVACIVAAVWHAWHSGDSRRAGLVMACTNTLGCIAVLTVFGSHALGWVYVVMVSNFFLAARKPAAVGGAALLAVVAWKPGLFDSTLAAATTLATSGLVGLYAWLFALRTEQQRDALAHQAACDPLTGTGNRRSMEQALAHAVSRHAQHREGYALMVLDLDHFKAVNDRHGHEAGDRVLTEFARVVESGMRSSDRLYRMGGEEFVLLLPGVDAAILPDVLRRIEDGLRRDLHAPDGPVGVSGGAAVLRDGEDWQGWLARADAALYEVKRSGRGRLRVAADDDLPQRSRRPTPA